MTIPRRPPSPARRVIVVVADVIIRTDPKTHVILWSGHPPDRLTFDGSPRVRFVQKPLDAEQLMAVVKEVLASE